MTKKQSQVSLQVMWNRLISVVEEQAQALVAKELNLPAGYSLSWSGQYEYMQRAKAKQVAVLLNQHEQQ